MSNMLRKIRRTRDEIPHYGRGGRDNLQGYDELDIIKKDIDAKVSFRKRKREN